MLIIWCDARPAGMRFSRITLVIGKWQERYFRESFCLSDTKVDLVTTTIGNDAFSRNLWYLWELPKLADEVKADLVHLSFPVPFRRSALGCPVVVTLHDLYPYDEPDNFGFPKVFFNRVFLQQCLREADCIACVSETTLSRLKARFPRYAHRKAVVIPNCVTINSSDHFEYVDKKEQFLLMVAQHRANKNIPLALKVFEELSSHGMIGMQTLLFLVGNPGPETSLIRSVIKQRALENRVRVRANVSDGELRWLYQNCELLIAPSWMEGFGLPVVEGLLCGSRVVCSDISAFREVGGQACHYFDLHAESRSVFDAGGSLQRFERTGKEVAGAGAIQHRECCGGIRGHFMRGCGIRCQRGEAMRGERSKRFCDRVNILGVGVDPVDMREAVLTINARNK